MSGEASSRNERQTQRFSKYYNEVKRFDLRDSDVTDSVHLRTDYRSSALKKRRLPVKQSIHAADITQNEMVNLISHYDKLSETELYSQLHTLSKVMDSMLLFN